MLPEPERPTGCISDLRLDGWFAGELAPEARGEVEAHLTACVRCRARRDELAAERETFLTARPAPVLRPGPAPAARSHRLVYLAVAIVPTAVAALFALVHRPATDPPADIRLKGGPSIGFIIQRAGRSVRAAPVYTVHPGDAIRFTYTSARAAHLAIYGLDAAGTASVYYPSGAVAARVAPGASVVVESAVVLDDVLGPERVYALFCDAAFALEPVRASLATLRALHAPRGCSVDELQWHKERVP